VWAILPFGTALLIGALRGRLPDALPDAVPGSEVLWLPDWRAADTWRLGLVLGGVGTVYFGTNAFIPDYVRAAGHSELIGPCLAVLNASQLPASAVALAFAGAMTGRRAPLLAVPIASAASLVLFLLVGPSFWVAGAGVVGFFTAFGLALTIAMPPLLVDDRDVHRLSAGMFAIGYGYSFLLPLVGGAAWDFSHIPAAAFLPVFAGAATTMAAGIGLPREAVRRHPMA
jgi:CP family cyanate transporter-like MFS transporter